MCADRVAACDEPASGKALGERVARQGICSVRESLCKYTLEELFTISNHPVTKLWESHG
jgi:hypothetical protein